MDIGNRIKKIRKELDLTQAEFATRIGSVQNTVTGYENGRRNPSSPVISLICREFNVNEEWLRTGIGNMFKTTPKSTLDALSEEYNLSNAAYIMVEKFINLKPEVQDTIFNYVKEVAMALQSKPVENDSTTFVASVTDFSKLTVDEKVNLYRQELEREQKVAEKSEVS